MTQVRPYRPSDRDALLTMALRLTEGVAPWRNDAGVRTAVTGWVTEAIGRVGQDGAVLLVAATDGEVIGFIGVSETEHWSGDRDAEIGELVVRTDAEGHGIGRALVDAGTAWASARGLANLTLGTGAANYRAREFYARLGFLEEDVRLALHLGFGNSSGIQARR